MRLSDASAAPPAYPLEGLLLQDESIYGAMDVRRTGDFVPLSFKDTTTT